MKKNLAPIALLLAATLMVIVLGCESNNTNPLSSNALGTVTGSVQLNPGVQGSVGRTTVAIYRSVEDFFSRQALAWAKTDEHGNYVITGVAPGNYYVDAWKDNDSNGGISKGDFYSVHCDVDGTLCNCCEPGTPMCECWTVNVVQ